MENSRDKIVHFGEIFTAHVFYAKMSSMHPVLIHRDSSRSAAAQGLDNTVDAKHPAGSFPDFPRPYSYDFLSLEITLLEEERWIHNRSPVYSIRPASGR